MGRSGWGSRPRVKSPWSGPSSFPSARHRAAGPDIGVTATPPRPTSGTDQPRLMKPIADAADGFDELAGLPELLPQALDADIDGGLPIATEKNNELGPGSQFHRVLPSETPEERKAKSRETV